MTDGSGQRALQYFTITVNGPLELADPSDQTVVQDRQITSFELPEAAGGSGGYTYTHLDTLPAGLTLNHSTRTISGRPTAAGTYTVLWRVTDSDSATVSQYYTITVNPPLALATPSDRTFTRDEEITVFTLPEATGGSGGYVYTHLGTLPDGLTFYPHTRNVRGTPTTAGTYTVLYRVTDSDAVETRRYFTITVNPPLELADPSDQTFVQDKEITSFTLPAATGGSGGYVYTHLDTLPDGLTLDHASRNISGTPTSSGAYTVLWRVTDSEGEQVSQYFTITVNATSVPIPTPTPTPTPAPGTTPTPTPTPTPAPVPTDPTKTTGVRVESATATSITLTWDQVAGARVYRLQYQTDSQWQNVAAAPWTSATLRGLACPGEYRYRVTAFVSGTGWGTPSEPVTARTSC